MHEALPDVYREMVSLGAGCGLRQGEIFGLAVEDVDFLGGVVRVTRQVKLIRGVQAVFGPPKGGKGLLTWRAVRTATTERGRPGASGRLGDRGPVAERPSTTLGRSARALVLAYGSALLRKRFSFWSRDHVAFPRRASLRCVRRPDQVPGTRIDPGRHTACPQVTDDPLTCTNELLRVTIGPVRPMNGWTQGPIRRRTYEMRAEG
ncbi:hypothetical protein [Streptomyces sp. NPDC056628]|uniref:hypothetical protein n=1 Tax=Streptomyces sp. NPDC056628 TaxID=3345882 RepID=UPI0036B99D14